MHASTIIKFNASKKILPFESIYICMPDTFRLLGIYITGLNDYPLLDQITCIIAAMSLTHSSSKASVHIVLSVKSLLCH